MEKTCSKCLIPKDTGQFYFNKTRNNVCISCYRIRARAYDKAYPEKNVERRLLYNYNLSITRRQELYDLQGGLCPICKRALDSNFGRRVNVDHNHVTNDVRGLLCTRCNTGLGKFEDDPVLLERARNYLLGSQDQN